MIFRTSWTIPVLGPVLVLAVVACAPDGERTPMGATADVGRRAPNAGVAVELPTPEDPALARGMAVYQRECASCHGVRAQGEPDWQITRPDGSLPAPPHDGSGHTWHHSDAELLQIIREGGTVYMPESNMPGFGDRLSDEEIRTVLDWMKSLWGAEERAYQSDMTRQWNEMRAAPEPADQSPTADDAAASATATGTTSTDQSDQEGIP